MLWKTAKDIRQKRTKIYNNKKNYRKEACGRGVGGEEGVYKMVDPSSEELQYEKQVLHEVWKICLFAILPFSPSKLFSLFIWSYVIRYGLTNEEPDIWEKFLSYADCTLQGPQCSTLFFRHTIRLVNDGSSRLPSCATADNVADSALVVAHRWTRLVRDVYVIH
jgi:hypothetical protein